MKRGVAIIGLMLSLANPAAAQTALSVVSDRDVRSADGRLVLAIHNTKDGDLDLSFIQRGNTYRLAAVDALITTPALTAGIWAPNSQTFAVNGSDGGWVGGWHTFFYQVQTNQPPRYVNIESILAPRLRHFAHCDGMSEINYQTVDWLQGGRQVVVLASVPDHSSCRNMDDYKAFVLDAATWRVVRVVPQARVPKRWLKNTTGGV